VFRVSRVTLAIALAACHAAPPAAPDARVALERTSCFGFCPAYRVVLYSDGSVRFTGMGDRAGRSDSASIAPDEVRALATRFEEAGFFAMDSAYTPGERGCGISATDHPYATLTARIGGREKTVRHYYGCTGTENVDSLKAWYVDSASNSPANRRGPLGTLARLAMAVDSLAGTSRWVGASQAR
jgi:uncharacterized protein DUF6438